MDTTNIGRSAEARVSEVLKESGHKIVAMNWRTRWCEIDIVSKTKNCVFFTEVKYRSSDEWGSGLYYVGVKKIRQMQFAAEFWLSQHHWQREVLLQAAEVSEIGEITLVEIT